MYTVLLLHSLHTSSKYIKVMSERFEAVLCVIGVSIHTVSELIVGQWHKGGFFDAEVGGYHGKCITELCGGSWEK
jgi:hypothetical protein